MIVDRRIAAQIAAHFCALSCDDPDFLAAREAVLPFAQTSHRAEELGLEIKECEDNERLREQNKRLLEVVGFMESEE